MAVCITLERTRDYEVCDYEVWGICDASILCALWFSLREKPGLQRSGFQIHSGQHQSIIRSTYTDHLPMTLAAGILASTVELLGTASQAALGHSEGRNYHSKLHDSHTHCPAPFEPASQPARVALGPVGSGQTSACRHENSAGAQTESRRLLSACKTKTRRATNHLEIHG